MKSNIAYGRINVFFAVFAAVGLINFALSKLYWPTLPAFPDLIDGHPVSSLLTEAGFAFVGVAIQVSLRNRPKYKSARTVAYVLTVGSASAAMFQVLDMLLRTVHPA